MRSATMLVFVVFLLMGMAFTSLVHHWAAQRGFDQGMERAGCGPVTWSRTWFPVIGWIEDGPRGYLCPGTENRSIYFDRAWKGPRR